ncbi:MAG: hypothetical protein GY927_17255 [bacterium]|nr:hypothetical protein [bacterium]
MNLSTALVPNSTYHRYDRSGSDAAYCSAQFQRPLTILGDSSPVKLRRAAPGRLHAFGGMPVSGQWNQWRFGEGQLYGTYPKDSYRPTAASRQAPRDRLQ